MFVTVNYNNSSKGEREATFYFNFNFLLQNIHLFGEEGT